MPKIGIYESPNLPSFEALQTNGDMPGADIHQELRNRVASDLSLYVHETTLEEVRAAFSQGAIDRQNYTHYDLDARKRIVQRRRELGIGSRP